MHNALVLLEEHLAVTTAGTAAATAHADLYAFLRHRFAGAASSPFQEHKDALHDLGNSGFKSARVDKADVKYVEDLSLDPVKLAALIGNLVKIVAEGKAGLAVNYSLFMGTWMAVIASVLHWERKSDEEKAKAEPNPWSAQLLKVSRSVMDKFTDAKISEKLDEFKESPIHDAMNTIWRKLGRFFKKVWQFIKSVFSRGKDFASRGEINVSKLLGTCVSAMRTFAVLSQNVEDVEFETKRLPGMPNVRTKIELA